MTEQEQKEQKDFLIEKIKQRPINRRKLLRRTVITASMAVIFGLIACVTFLVLEPVISNWLYPEEKPQIIVFPEDQEEMSPEDMLAENIPTPSPAPTPHVTLEQPNGQMIEQQVALMIDAAELDMDSQRELYDAMSEYVDSLKQYMVTITTVTEDADWLSNVQENRNQAAGILVANNGKELLVLADVSSVRLTGSLTLTFSNDVKAEATVKQRDEFTDLAILAVDLETLPKEMKEMPLATLGRSNSKRLAGTPVVAMGRPLGVNNSIGYGMISADNTQIYAPDRNYQLLTTDITGSAKAGGILFNLYGEVLGVITTDHAGTDVKNLISAYGITELKKVIEKMSNASPVAYFGITGLNVSAEANMEQGVPYGAFVKEVILDSPAMLAGIQKGDVITKVNGKEISTYGEFSMLLIQQSPGDTLDLVIKRPSQNEYKEMEFSVELGQ